MRFHGLNAGTVSPQERLVRVYLWVNHSQDAAIAGFVAELKGSIQDVFGKGTLIGADSRVAAQREFDRRIPAYERTHHSSWSKLL
jgi:hypothetical protein